MIGQINGYPNKITPMTLIIHRMNKVKLSLTFGNFAYISAILGQNLTKFYHYDGICANNNRVMPDNV